jgi:hypothetical protein
MFHKNYLFVTNNITYAPNTTVEKHEFKTQNDNR